MSTRNFATHAMEALERTYDEYGQRMAKLTLTDPLYGDLSQARNTIVEFSVRLRKAIKFIGPTNGIFLDRLDQGDDGVDLPRLPYECICLELPLDLTGPGALQGDKPRAQPDRAVVLAYYPDENLGFSQATRDQHGIRDGEFLVMAAFGFPRDRPNPWTVYPGAVLVTNRADQAGVFRLTIENAPRSILMLPVAVKLNTTHSGRDTVGHDLGPEAIAICEMCNLLQCTNIVTDTLSPPEALNAKRASKGKVPFFEYRVLKIQEGGASAISSGGTHSSPRLHYRRGHIRRLPDQRKTWVRPAMVGDKSRGLIVKDYDVTGGAA